MRHHRDEWIARPSRAIVRGLGLLDRGFGIVYLGFDLRELIGGWPGAHLIVILLRGSDCGLRRGEVGRRRAAA